MKPRVGGATTRWESSNDRENKVSHNTADTTPQTGDRGVSTPMSISQWDTFSAHLAGTHAHAHAPAHRM
jgi:hypothetical protein